ncbi:MAG TPA: potassium transporter TrkG [Longimicrobiales bacterium]|nr:potassium transporter TrkG [Longimicrobiales bacterium]
MVIPRFRGWINQWDVATGRGFRWWRNISPPQLFVGSFLGLIVFGTLGLRFLPGLYVGERLGWIDSLFTATSAVCVTGLIVVDTATYFTVLGQGFILLLIQLGGLGIVTFTTIIIMLLGRRVSLRQHSASLSVAEIAPHINYRHLALNILVFTAIFEVSGAILLLFSWAPRLGFGNAVWHAVFHAVSAFCNAGFSTFSTSLIEFRESPLPMVTVMALIVAGGIGFLTIEELWVQRAQRRKRLRRTSDQLMPRLSLHSRLVLATTATLLAGGWLFFTLYEWHITFQGMPAWARVMNGLFMSVTARTAGFNTIDYADAADGSNFLTILLMFIGGSPGSMAGGVKTTTIAVIGLLAWSRYMGRGATSVLGRSIPDETSERAIGLFVVAFGLVTLAIFIFTTTEIGAVSHSAAPVAFLPYMFEAVSAFNTVGLSMGVTADLSAPGRIVTTLLMYLGRVGPLTFAAAIALRATARGDFRYAYEDVVIG